MLRDIVFRAHLDVFRRALLGDPPARVEPMTVRLQPGTRAVRTKLRASPPAKAAWLHDTIVALAGLFTPHRVPPGVLNAIGYFQATMGDVLDGYIDKICLVWVEHRGHRVIWVPVRADSLKKQLLVCAHLEGAGHRGVDATMARLERHCVWDHGKTAVFHGRRLRSGGSSIQSGQAPQAYEHLDRTVACYQRRQRARVRSAAHGHSRTARRPWRG